MSGSGLVYTTLIMMIDQKKKESNKIKRKYTAHKMEREERNFW
jgi:hypothetical protein